MPSKLSRGLVASAFVLTALGGCANGDSATDTPDEDSGAPVTEAGSAEGGKADARADTGSSAQPDATVDGDSSNAPDAPLATDASDTDASDTGAINDASDAGDGRDAADASDSSSSVDASDGGSSVDASDAAVLLDATSECRPTPLVCDGLAHACDGVVDKGCPNGITFGAPVTDSPQWGGTGGSAFSDPCPAGQVLIGMAGTVSGYIDSIRGICGIVTVVEDRSTSPYGYRVRISIGTTLSAHGLHNATTPWSTQCPVDQAIVAIDGRSGQGLDQVQLECAPLVVSGAPGSFTISQGTLSVQTVQGGTGGSPFTRFACPSPQVVSVISGRSGDSVDQLSLECQTPTLTVN